MGLSTDNESMKREGTKAVSQRVCLLNNKEKIPDVYAAIEVSIFCLDTVPFWYQRDVGSVVAQGVTPILGRVYRVKL